MTLQEQIDFLDELANTFMEVGHKVDPLLDSAWYTDAAGKLEEVSESIWRLQGLEK